MSEPTVKAPAIPAKLPLGMSARDVRRAMSHWSLGSEYTIRDGVVVLDERAIMRWVLSGRRKNIWSAVPTALYRHFDAAGALLYVGISLGPLARLYQHGSSPWVREIARVDLQWFDSRGEALAAEESAIKVERPKHNIIHMDDAP